MFGVDDLILAGIGSGLASGAFGLLGQKSAQDIADEQYNKEMELRNKVTQELGQQLTPYDLPGINYNPLLYQSSNIPELQQYQLQNLNIPEEMKAKLVEEDPKLKQAQLDALNNILQRSQEGMSAREKATFAKNRQLEGEQARGRELATLQNMEARGMGGSGLEAVQRQMSNQAMADRLSQEGLNQDAMNADIRNQALQNLLSGTGQVRSQDLQAGTTNADIINRFTQMNSQAKNQAINANIQAQNQRNQEIANQQNQRNLMNWQNQQQVGQSNIAQQNQAQLTNQQNVYNKALAEQGNKQDIAKTIAGAKLGVIPSQQAKAASDAAAARAPWNTLATLPGIAYGAYSQGKQRNDIEDMYNNLALSNYLSGNTKKLDPSQLGSTNTYGGMIG